MLRAEAMSTFRIWIIAALLVTGLEPVASVTASAQITQQGSKLVGTGAVGGASQGSSTALSADGNTAIVGGPNDNNGVGAATRSGGVWTQQGSKLVGTGAVGGAWQGSSVALSADGNTAIVGGPDDNRIGAAWVFTRSGGVWTQQGSKLVGTGAVGGASQGSSVALSADGNTAIVGGLDNNSVEGAWVFTRNGGVWTQQGSKLVGTGAAKAGWQGSSLALSPDGNTAIVSAWAFTRSRGIWTQQGSKPIGADAVGANGYSECSVALAAGGDTAILGCAGLSGAWVFARGGGVWTQQGSKLVGTGAVGFSQQGSSVALSADGNTAIIGGMTDGENLPVIGYDPPMRSPTGAAWLFTRSSGVWTQQGSKLVGTGAAAGALQGTSVALSADGNTAMVGGRADNGDAGAAWVFVQPAMPGKSNGAN
ncbi:MAG: hypothetical protein WB760_15900 [Xanthobacteraceae bacterium]